MLVRFGIGFFAIAPPLLSMYAVAPYVMRFRLDASKGLCRRCGYDLRASKNSCPECGEAIPRGLPNTTTHQDLQGKS